MIGKQKDKAIGRKVYFKEKRGNNTEEKYYIGTVIGYRDVILTSSNIFGGEVKKWADRSLLLETSDHRKVQAYQLDTFEVDS